MIRLFSLIKSLFLRSGYKLLKCVSPLSMGAVLAIFICPLNVHAFDSSKDIDREVIVQMRSFFSHQTQYSDSFTLWQYANNEHAGESCRIDFNDFNVVLPSEIKTEYTVQYSNNTSNTFTQTSTIDYSFVKLHLIVNGKDYVIDMNRIENDLSGPSSGISKIDLYKFSGGSNRNISIYADLQGSGRLNILCYLEFCQTDFLNIFKNHYYDRKDYDSLYYAAYGLPVDFTGNIKIYLGQSGVSTPDYDDPTIDSIERGTEQDKLFHDIDQQDAQQAGSDMTGFASQLDNLKNTWSILWYPIEFTNRFIQVFVGGTSAVAYQDEFAYITGYTYNDDTGFLEPIMARSVQPASAGTGITFPAFSLMGYQIWDSYTYDLSQVKDQLPVVFDALYVIISILEMLWFVGYLRKKYEEVFG